MREFPQTAGVEINAFVWLIPILILGFATLAVIQWRKQHQAGVIDAALWILTSLILLVVASTQCKRGEVLKAFELYGAVVGFVAVIGCVVSWVRLGQQEKSNQVVLSVVISFVVLALASLIALPSLQQAREYGPRITCRSNLHLIGLGLYNYEDTSAVWPSQQSGEPPHSWRVAILPYVDRPYLFDEYDFSATWDDDGNPILSLPIDGIAGERAADADGIRPPRW